MSRLKMRATIPFVLALVGWGLIACLPAATSQVTPEAQPEVGAIE